MAQALLQQMLAEQGLTQVSVRSAGTAAVPGDKASPLAAQALQEIGVDLSNHSAQEVNGELVAWADLILAMTRRHREFVISAFPEAADKTYLLQEFVTVSDQGQDQTIYELHATMAAKQAAFAAAVHPNISELRERRNQLLQELAQVEELLAERQAELLAQVRQERQQLEQLEQAHGNLDIVDPFGQPLAVYRASRDELQNALQQLLARLQRERP